MIVPCDKVKKQLKQNNKTMKNLTYLLAILISFQTFAEETKNDTIKQKIIRKSAVKKSASTGGTSFNGTPQMVNMPSPTVAGLIRAGNVQSNLYTGAVNVNIPLYTLPSKEISAPISLSYNSNGVRVDDRPTTTGITWTLATGGVITRIVKGSPDELEMENEVEEESKIIDHGEDDYDCDLGFSTCHATINLITHMWRHKDGMLLSDIDDNWDGGHIFVFKIENQNKYYNYTKNYLQKQKGYFKIYNKLNFNDIYSKLTDENAENKEKRDEAKEEKWDYQPDKFYFSFLGGGGYFYIDPKTKKPIIFSNADIKIETDNNFSNFTIITNNGIKYYFGTTNNSVDKIKINTNNYSVVVSHIPKKGNNYDSRSFINSYFNYKIKSKKDYKISWYLTKIESPNLKDEIIFVYNKNKLIKNKNHSISLSINKKINQKNISNEYSSDETYFINQTYNISELISETSPTYLSQIISKQGKIEFLYTDKTDIQNSLYKIKISDKYNNHIKSFGFEYDEENNSSGIIDFSKFQLGYKMYKDQFRKPQPDNLTKYFFTTSFKSEHEKLSQRNFLKKILEYSKNEGEFITAYEFEYINPSNLPMQQSYKQNFYGFYKNYSNLKSTFYNYTNSLDIGNEYYNKLALNVDYKSTPTNPSNSTIEYGLLNEIIFQNGKTQEFNYNINEWGCTVNNIVTKENNNIVDTINYKYFEPSEPYGINKKIHEDNSGDNYIISPKGFTEQLLTQGAVKGYGKIEATSTTKKTKQIVYFTTANNYDNNNAITLKQKRVIDKIEHCYNFYTIGSDGKKEHFVMSECRDENFNPTTVPNFYNYIFEYEKKEIMKTIIGESENDWGFPTDRDFLRGKIKQKQVFDIIKKDIISQEKYYYNLIPMESISVKPVEPKYNKNILKFELSTYDIKYELLQLNKKTSWAKVDGKENTTETTYEYLKDNPKYIEKTINTNILTNVVNTQEVCYPFTINNSEINSSVKDYFTNKNIKAIPIKTISKIKIPDEEEKIAGGSHSFFRIENNHAVLDHKKQYFNNDWETTVTIDKYDRNFNILEYHGRDNIPISFKWENYQPVIKAVNLGYNEIKNLNPNVINGNQFENASITTYSYYHLIGLKSVTEPNGLKIEYFYDNFGRLLYVKDFEGNLMKQNIYNYSKVVTIEDLGIGEMQIGISFIVR